MFSNFCNILLTVALVAAAAAFMALCAHVLPYFVSLPL